MKRLILAAAVLLSSLTGQAQNQDYGQALNSVMTSTEIFFGQCTVAVLRSQTGARRSDGEICMTYLLGMWDGFILTPTANEPQKICSDKPVQAIHLATYYVQWVQEHPASKNQPRHVSASAMLRDKFKCNT